MLEFEDFLFGRDRTALERIAEGLLDLQNGDCFYCHTALSRNREIDHFMPWSHSGDDGLDNLVAACHRCNNSKRATLAAQTTSPTSSNATVPGPMTSLPFRTSGGGHATPTVLSVLRAPPTSTPLANDRFGSWPRAGRCLKAFNGTAKNSQRCSETHTRRWHVVGLSRASCRANRPCDRLGPRGPELPARRY